MQDHLSKNETTVETAVVVPDCGAAFEWHVYWLGLWLGCLFTCVLWVLVGHWAKLPSMYHLR